MGVHKFPILNPFSPPTPYHLSGSSPCTSPKHPVSCIEHRLVIRFLHDIIHVSMPFSQIIPPSPSPTESKSPFYTSVSLLLSRIHGYHYHLSKFHIYVLVMVQLSHPYLTTGKTVALTRRTFVSKIMSLLLNMLSTLVITFLPRSKHLLIS